MQPRNRSIALLLGVGAVALTQSVSFAIRPVQPVVDPMPTGAPFASQKTDFTPKPATATIDASAYAHPTAKVLGDVRVGANTWIGPRASIRADLGHNILIGANTNIQDGVVIWGYATEAAGKKLPKRSIQELFLQANPKEASTSVKIEENVSLLSQSQVVGPSLIEQGSFIGAGALIYQSRIGAGSVIEAGAQVLNVELPPNTFVGAGQVISNPEVAKRLPTKDEARADQNKQMTELYTRLTRGYLGKLDAGIPQQQKMKWNAARKEVIWMPSIPLFESPDFKSPSTDETSTRNTKAITIGDVSLAQASTVEAGATLRADHGAKIEVKGALIEEGAILVADLSAHIEAPLPASQPASAPTSEPAGDVAPTEPLPGPRPPIDALRPEKTEPYIPPAPKDLRRAPVPTSMPTTEPTSTSLPASLPAPKTPGIFMADQSKVGAAAVIYGSSNIQEGAVIKPRAIVIHSDIGRNAIISEGAVVSNVYIPEGRLVAPGRSISTQEDALSLPTVPGYILGQAPATLEKPALASGAAMIDPMATSDLTMIGGSVLRAAANAYISDHTFLSARNTGSIELGVGAFIQSGATLHTDKTITIAARATISAQAFISGGTTIAEDSVIGARAFVEDSTIGKGAVVEPGAIVRNANIPENTLVPAGTVWAEGATQAISADSAWRVAQPELVFAATSFAAVYAETPRKAELRGANQPKKATGSAWDMLFTQEAILFALLILALLGVLGFGVREVEK